LKGFLEKLENEKEKHAILFFLLGIFSGVALQWWIVAVAFFAISAMILRSLWVLVCVIIVAAALSYFGVLDLNGIIESINLL
jgi:thiol:disulfide interchange protein